LPDNWSVSSSVNRPRSSLEESEDNLRTYLENAPDGVYLSDLNGKFLYVNKKTEVSSATVKKSSSVIIISK